VHIEVKSQVTIDSVDYFYVQLWNEDNDSAFDDLYVRSTEQALYSYNPAGDDYMYFQKAPVGTEWSFYQEDDSGSGFNYRVIEIIDIVPVTVPYGIFDTAYIHRKYRCVDPDDLSKGQSPSHYQWMVPGVGWVKEVQWWPKQNQIPPLTMELVHIVLPEPPGLSGWVWMPGGCSGIGYSLEEDCLVYFLSFGPIWYYNSTTSLWDEEGPVGLVYVDWPFLYEIATGSLWFALLPESGLWVYHFCVGQWELLPRILP